MKFYLTPLTLENWNAEFDYVFNILLTSILQFQDQKEILIINFYPY